MAESLGSRFAQHINKNKLGLCTNNAGGNISDTLTFFVENGIFSEEERQAVDAVAKPFNKADKLFDVLKGKVNFLPQIVTHFQKQLQNVRAEILGQFLKENLSLMPKNDSTESNSNTAATATNSNEKKNVASSSTGLQVLSSKTTTTSVNANPVLGTSTESDARVFSNASSNISAVSSDTPGTYDETKAKIARLLKNYRTEEYPRKTKGFALIINHVRFNRRPMDLRLGAEEDQNNLVQVLQELDFLVYGLVDRTYMELKGDIESFLAIVAQEKPDCLVVAVMSHGNKDNYFMTYDRGWMSSWSEIVEKFNNANCPALKGKPKIFLFQFCRGDAADGGTQRDSTFPDDESGPSSIIPSWTDMLVCYSTLDGHYAYRDTTEGTWFIQFICQALREHGHTLEICSLLNLVSEMMKIQSTSEGEKQICPYYNIGFTKQFYLSN